MAGLEEELWLDNESWQDKLAGSDEEPWLDKVTVLDKEP